MRPPSARARLRPFLTAAVVAGAFFHAGRASAVEPWSDADPAAPPERHAVGEDYGLRAGAEYRANWLYVNPVSLNSERERRLSWLEHRLRLEGTVDWHEKVRIVASADVLDGALWGDNGTYGGDPSSNAGTNVSVKNPNVARPCVAYKGGDPLERDAYGYGLCSQGATTIRRAYGEVVTPVGLLRIGRQPTAVGNALQANDGDGRKNRFGFARSGNFSDRILFATKPLEAFKRPEDRDRTDQRGVFLILAYDRLVTEDPQLFGDDVQQTVEGIRWLEPSRGQDLFLFHVHRWDGQYSTKVESFGVRAMMKFGDVTAGLESATNLGSTREVAAAYKTITNDPVVDQTIRQLGIRSVVRWDQPLFSLYLEGDYASGDDDPQARTPLSQFLFAEDSNVGLLMFKHALGFQSARAAAAGTETLRRLGATVFPTEAIATRGAFTDAIAIFPQVDVRPHRNVLLRAGVLKAWAPAPVIDPVASLQNRKGLDIANDLVNFAGGKPGRNYGTEIDGRFQWRYEEHFAFDLEGAILFPGDAFQDANGTAVRSVLLQGRTTFFF
jgi:hypothetical protein